MKKIISILCVAAILLSTFSIMAFAADTSYKPYEESQYFTYGDYDIHYRVIPAQGKFKGRIMMLHGFMCSTFAWRNMADEMSKKGYECVLADLPNFGYSTRETADMEIIDREILITKLMESIAPMDEWILAGHSMGGGVAVNIAIENPVKALLLYCPAPQSEFPEAMKGLIQSDIMKGTMNVFFKYGTEVDPLVKMVIFMATLDCKFSKDYELDGVTDAVQYDGFGAGMCEMMYNVRPTDLENVDEIQCPVLLVQASGDMVLNAQMKDQMNSAFPDATTYNVIGGGHQCIENRAKELATVTSLFLWKNK